MARRAAPPKAPLGQRIVAAIFTIFVVVVAAQFLGVSDELFAAVKTGIGSAVDGIQSDAASDSLANGVSSATESDPDVARKIESSVQKAQDLADEINGVGQTESFRAAQSGLENLAVKGKAPMTGYSRDEFGPEWADVDKNGCDTRNDILARDLVDETLKAGTKDCVVLAGTLPYEPYTGDMNRKFERGNPSKGLDAEHIVALGNGWVSGASKWNEAKRTQFANDPANLMMVDPGQNRSKGDRNAAEWLPKNKAYRCEYIRKQIEIKGKYGLSVTQPEKDAMAGVLSDCTG